MLVLFMMGLITALTTPFLSSTLDRAKGQSDVRKIASTLRYARSQAIARKTSFAFTASIEGKRYWLTEAKANEIEGTSVNLSPGVRFTQFMFQDQSTSKGEIVIVFYPQGNSSGGSINMEATVSNKPSLFYSITLDPVTGKPHIESEAIQ